LDKQKNWQSNYERHTSENICNELIHPKAAYQSHLQECFVSPINLLDKLRQLKFEIIFSKCSRWLSIFCTIPVTVAQADGSFTSLSRIKDELAIKLDFSEVTDLFANHKP
jgi:hypothetical protein